MENALYLPSISVALYDRALQAARAGEACNVIMLCTASIEAFINEYIELGSKLIEQKQKHDQQQDLKRKLGINSSPSIMTSALYPVEISLVNALKVHEHERKNIFIKINTIRNYCVGGEWKKNHEVYRDYCTLVKLRNALTHPRSRMIKYGENDIPKFLLPFYQQKSIDYFNKINSRNSWIEAIDTIKFSEWCINAFEKMMILLLNDMYSAKMQDYPNIPLLTNDNALYYFKSFKFPEKLIKKLLIPL